MNNYCIFISNSNFQSFSYPPIRRCLEPLAIEVNCFQAWIPTVLARSIECGNERRRTRAKVAMATTM